MGWTGRWILLRYKRGVSKPAQPRGSKAIYPPCIVPCAFDLFHLMWLKRVIACCRGFALLCSDVLRLPITCPILVSRPGNHWRVALESWRAGTYIYSEIGVERERYDEPRWWQLTTDMLPILDNQIVQ